MAPEAKSFIAGRASSGKRPPGALIMPPIPWRNGMTHRALSCENPVWSDSELNAQQTEDVWRLGSQGSRREALRRNSTNNLNAHD
jgi:hypothetical protein